MNARIRIVTWVTAIVALIAIGLALDRGRRAQAAADAMVVAGRQRDALRHRLQQAEERLAVAERDEAAWKESEAQKPGEATPAAPDTASAAGTAVPRPTREMDPRIVAARDGALRELHLKAFEAGIDGQWGPLFRRLNLAPEKIEQFKAILLNHERNRLDVTAVAGDQNLSLGDAAVQKQRSDDGVALAREMRGLLDPQDLKVYNQYHHDLELQPIVAELAGQVYFTETPLDLPQAQELMTILSSNSEKRNYGFVRPNTVNWEAALAQVEANPIFSPALRDAFGRLRAEKMTETQLGKSLEEAMKNNAVNEPVSITLPGSGFMLRTGR
jgi:hypothetical protein